MTETEWLEATNPAPLLEFVVGRASERKLRLLAVAFCRCIWRLLVYRRSRYAVEVAEAFADGVASRHDLAVARRTAHRAETDGFVAKFEAEADANFRPTAAYRRVAALHAATIAAEQTAVPSPALAAACHDWVAGAVDLAAEADFYTKRGYGWSPDSCETDLAAGKPARYAEQKAQALLVRDLFGNPFVSSPTIGPGWLTWNEGCIRRIAQTIYHQRRFEDLPILADALEEAGCTEAHILGHCRSGGDHARGCWVVDHLLCNE